MNHSSEIPAGVRSIRSDLLLGISGGLGAVRLAGTKCRSCGETTLGQSESCPNCASDDVAHVSLNNHGTVWTYTIARHRPPGNYRGPEPFVPFGIALVELPEGLRVMTRVDCDIETLHVGMPVEFTPYLRHDADGVITVTFTYKPVAEH